MQTWRQTYIAAALIVLAVLIATFRVGYNVGAGGAPITGDGAADCTVYEDGSARCTFRPGEYLPSGGTIAGCADHHALCADGPPTVEVECSPPIVCEPAADGGTILRDLDNGGTWYVP